MKEATDRDLTEYYDLIDRHLAGRGWLVGSERTAADLFLFMLTRWSRNLEPVAWHRPDLRAHWLRALELRGVSAVLDEQGLALPELAARTDDPSLLATSSIRLRHRRQGGQRLA